MADVKKKLGTHTKFYLPITSAENTDVYIVIPLGSDTEYITFGGSGQTFTNLVDEAIANNGMALVTRENHEKHQPKYENTQPSHIFTSTTPRSSYGRYKARVDSVVDHKKENIDETARYYSNKVQALEAEADNEPANPLENGETSMHKNLRVTEFTKPRESVDTKNGEMPLRNHPTVEFIKHRETDSRNDETSFRDRPTVEFMKHGDTENSRNDETSLRNHPTVDFTTHRENMNDLGDVPSSSVTTSNIRQHHLKHDEVSNEHHETADELTASAVDQTDQEGSLADKSFEEGLSMGDSDGSEVHKDMPIYAVGDASEGGKGKVSANSNIGDGPHMEMRYSNGAGHHKDPLSDSNSIEGYNEGPHQAAGDSNEHRHREPSDQAMTEIQSGFGQWKELSFSRYWRRTHKRLSSDFQRFKWNW